MKPITEWEIRIQVRDVGVQAERHRCVGLVLAAYGQARIAGNLELADALDALATRMEHPELEH